MTRPVSNSSLNYTPYHPSLEQSRADDGTGGAGAVGSGGTQGAGGVPHAPQNVTEHEPDPCVSELMKAVSACGSAYFSGRSSSPATPLAVLNCAANVLDLLECATVDKASAKAR